MHASHFDSIHSHKKVCFSYLNICSTFVSHHPQRTHWKYAFGLWHAWRASFVDIFCKVRVCVCARLWAQCLLRFLIFHPFACERFCFNSVIYSVHLFHWRECFFLRYTIPTTALPPKVVDKWKEVCKDYGFWSLSTSRINQSRQCIAVQQLNRLNSSKRTPWRC